MKNIFILCTICILCLFSFKSYAKSIQYDNEQINYMLENLIPETAYNIKVLNSTNISYCLDKKYYIQNVTTFFPYSFNEIYFVNIGEEYYPYNIDENCFSYYMSDKYYIDKDQVLNLDFKQELKYKLKK